MSFSIFEFGVVNNFSPTNIEFAPAKKQRAWSSSDIFSRPAAILTYDVGRRILASAIVRTKSKISISSEFSRGVPGILTSLLIGTDFGGVLRFARRTSIFIRSSFVSPIPKIPPEHTFILYF